MKKEIQFLTPFDNEGNNVCQLCKSSDFIFLYAFVDSKEFTYSGNVINLKYSAVKVDHFHDVETLAGNCNPQNPNDRKDRIKYLNETYPLENIWELYLDIEGIEHFNMINIISHEASWLLLALSKSYDQFHICKRFPGESIEKSYGLYAVGHIHPYAIERLEEIFSLNHIADIKIEDEDSTLEPEIAPLPFTPSGTKAISLPEDKANEIGTAYGQ